MRDTEELKFEYIPAQFEKYKNERTRTVKPSYSQLLNISENCNHNLKSSKVSKNQEEEKGQNLQKIDEDESDDFDEFEVTAVPQAGVLAKKQVYKQTSIANFSTNNDSLSQKSSIQGIPKQNKDSLLSNQPFDRNLTRLQKLPDLELQKDLVNKIFQLSDTNQIIIGSLVDKFKPIYKDHIDYLYNRAVMYQLVHEINYKNKVSNEGDDNSMLKFLSEHSLRYKNVINLKELARGGEAVVYRLQHIDLDEVVAKCTLIDSQQQDQQQRHEQLLDIFSESQQLKLLANDNYIAQVKEEIIVIDKAQGNLSQYVAIVERAKNTLHDVLQIWRSKKSNKIKLRELFSPEALTYYFYQIISIVHYLNSRGFYFGDMKPQNLLVFRDQRIKIGDLGISIMNDPTIDLDEQAYNLKGLTQAYASQEMIQAFKRNEKVSTNKLMMFDKFSLMRTLEKCILATDEQYLKYHKREPKLYENMFNDLRDKSLKETIEKWTVILATDKEFCLKLSMIFKEMGKMEAIASPMQISNYRNIVNEMILDPYRSFQIQSKITAPEQHQYAQYNRKIDVQDIQVEETLYLDMNQVKVFKQDQQFKHIVLCILETLESKIDKKPFQQLLKDPIARGKLESFFQYSNSTFHLLGHFQVKITKLINKEVPPIQKDQFYYFSRWMILAQQDPEKWQANSSSFKSLMKIISNQGQQIPDDVRQFQKLSDLMEIKCRRASEKQASFNIDEHVKALEKILTSENEPMGLIIDETLKEVIILLDRFKDQLSIEILKKMNNILSYEKSMEFELQFISEGYLMIIEAYILEQEGKNNEAIKVYNKVIELFIDFFSEAHFIILQVYGNLGKLMVQDENSDQNLAKQYLYKYEKYLKDQSNSQN
ncbi:protein kinase domain containing protein [Stylonychia lemnae]|uniref:Protein kinase domain containing protein n=1 Tax=Stylonychia lemnae TaxID=5949 RepID=A0A078B2N6_STYLE|nr:protein kinase domain containing protein [Stylonychia lemnae]|eukprot:CDW87753.1 protein kinase domain containing protein [Stylonychia lemnae]